MNIQTNGSPAYIVDKDGTRDTGGLDDCLNELRRIFPDQVCEISFRTAGLGLVKVTAWENNIIPRERVSKFGNTLSEAMAQVRKWHDEH